MVKFWTNWENTQKFEYASAGRNFEGMDKVLHCAEWYEWAEEIVCFDVTNQDTIAFLRKVYPEKSIWGCGMAFKLEQNRWGLKKVLRDIGVKTSASVKIKGVTELRKYLTENKDKYVKINAMRGDIESFYAKDIKSCEMIIDEIEAAFGPFKDEYEFIVEDTVHTDVEIGCDLIFNGNDYLKPYIYGYEVSKMAYIGRVTNKLPKLLEDQMDKLKPVLKKLDYRACISTELKVTSKTEGYFLDITCRLPSPLCALYPEYITNWPEVVNKVGLKKDVKLDIRHKYVGALPLNSFHGLDYWIAIDVDKKDREHVKFYCAGQHDGRYYSVKGSEKIAVIIAGGDTVQEVIDILKKYTGKVSAYGLDKDVAHTLDNVARIIEDGKKMDLDF